MGEGRGGREGEIAEGTKAILMSGYGRNPALHRVLVTGGAGYVGAVLVPRLLDLGYEVTVLDLYLYGDDVLAGCRGNRGFREVKGDIRDAAAVKRALEGCDAVIHLACISNDPSFELDPTLGRSINLDAFVPLVRAAKKGGVKRFIYASSSSVYGIKEGVEVTEDLSLEPLTDYSRFKADCEALLAKERAPGFVAVTIRPATVCGYSPRQRLDVVVNILTNLGYNKGEISVFGGSQLRPNIHIDDMAEAYVALLAAPDKLVDGKVFNAGYENHSVLQLAEMVQRNVGEHVKLKVQPTNDLRSYHVSSKKIKEELGFEPAHSIEDAVVDLIHAFKAGKLPNSLEDPRYFNIKMMQKVSLR
jgi:nucleoside-diphosphate-sugar epimerase